MKRERVVGYSAYDVGLEKDRWVGLEKDLLKVPDVSAGFSRPSSGAK